MADEGEIDAVVSQIAERDQALVGKGFNTFNRSLRCLAKARSEG